MIIIVEGNNKKERLKFCNSLSQTLLTHGEMDVPVKSITLDGVYDNSARLVEKKSFVSSFIANKTSVILDGFIFEDFTEPVLKKIGKPVDKIDIKSLESSLSFKTFLILLNSNDNETKTKDDRYRNSLNNLLFDLVGLKFKIKTDPKVEMAAFLNSFLALIDKANSEFSDIKDMNSGYRMTK